MLAVAIIAPGAMGAAVGQRLVENRALACAQAGMKLEIGALDAFLRQG